MLFPRVKEFAFCVNRASPLEIAARTLARKNEHADWCQYQFSHIEDTGLERCFKDLTVRFDLIASYMSNSVQSSTNNNSQEQQGPFPANELILFYKVGKNLEKIYSQVETNREIPHVDVYSNTAVDVDEFSDSIKIPYSPQA